MKRGIRWAALGVGGVVVVLGIVLALNVNNSDPNVGSGRFTGKDEIAPGFALASQNGMAPQFTLETLDGAPLRLSDLIGKTVVVNFWNTWCPPCIEETPALKEFYERHKNDPDLAMVGIVRDPRASESEVRAYAKREGIDWIVALDPKDKASLAYGTTGQPETFVVGPDGRVAGEQFSATTVENLELMLNATRTL